MDKEQFIRDLYARMFGREADEGGLQDWLDYTDQGHTFLDVYNGFLNSAEGRRTYVRELYHHLLGREGKDNEVQSWVDQLAAGSSQTDVLKGFLYSDEYKRNHQ